jgi:hypothetical protein
VNEIAVELQMEPTNVRKSLQRLSSSERNRQNKQQKGMHTHNLIEPWKKREAVRGECLAWAVVDGEAIQCGVPCKGQLCEEHAHTTRPIINPLGRGMFG